jgi:hypothetical protein
MIGMNISSIYGGILKEQYWESKHNDKLFDRKILRGTALDIKGWDINDIMESSSNEDEDRYVQRYDDDKMELMGATEAINLSLFRLS